jgi:hypothetical protein
MLALCSLLTAVLFPPPDPLYNGLWITPKGDWFLMEDGGFHAMLGRYMFTGGANRPVDNGGLYGTWWSAQLLHVHDPAPRHPWVYFDQEGAEAPAYAGEIRVVPGQMSGATMDSLNLNLRNSYQDQTFQGPVYRVGDETKIQVGGHYHGTYLDLKVHEGGIIDFPYPHIVEEGDLQIGTNTYSFIGWRRFDRSCFKLIDKDNGSEAGMGWLLWDPTPDCTQKLTGEDSKPTDRIKLWVIARDVYTSGGIEEMTEVGSSPTPPTTSQTNAAPAVSANPFTGKWKGKVTTDLGLSVDAVVTVTATGQLSGTYTIGTVQGEYQGTLDKDGTLTMKAYTPGQSAIDITGTLAIDPKSQDLTGTVTQVYQGQASKATFDLTKS